MSLAGSARALPFEDFEEERSISRSEPEVLQRICCETLVLCLPLELSPESESLVKRIFACLVAEDTSMRPQTVAESMRREGCDDGA